MRGFLPWVTYPAIDFLSQFDFTAAIADWQTMHKLLAALDFSDISRCELRQGRCREMLIDDDKYEWESLYVEAVKASVENP